MPGFELPKRSRLAAIIILVLVVGVLLGVALARYLTPPLAPRDEQALAAVQAKTAQDEVVLACPGRIEGLSEIVKVGAGIDGLIKSVPVKEGQQVAAGELLAEIDRPDLAAALQEARAAVESAVQSRLRLLRGSREEERQVAADQRAEAEARLLQAQKSQQRVQRLFESGDISQDVGEQAKRDLQVAEAALRAAQQREKLANAQALPEEVLRAEAQIKAAQEKAKSIAELLKKCRVRAPISGTVLRLHIKPGEMVSTVTPLPLLSLADTSGWRVRAEVDERDLSHVQLGQRVEITADVFNKGVTYGAVSRIGSSMGRSNIKTGAPTEKSDRDVMEVLIDLEPPNPVNAAKQLTPVVGLRVTARFLNKGS